MGSNCKITYINNQYNSKLVELWYYEITFVGGVNWQIAPGNLIGSHGIINNTQLDFTLVEYHHLPNAVRRVLYITHTDLRNPAAPSRLLSWSAPEVPTIQNHLASRTAAVPFAGTQLPADLSSKALISWYWGPNGPARAVANTVDSALQECKLQKH